MSFRDLGGSLSIMSPADEDSYFRAANGSVYLPAAGYDYGGNWAISTGGTYLPPLERQLASLHHNSSYATSAEHRASWKASGPVVHGFSRAYQFGSAGRGNSPAGDTRDAAKLTKARAMADG